MTPSEFKKIGRLLKELYAVLKVELQEAGVDLYSNEYDALFKSGQEAIRERLLEKMGYTLEEYREAKALVETKEPSEVLNQIKEGIDAVRNTHIPSADEITDLAKGVIPAPQVTHKTVNKIVKEKIIEKPTVIRETVVKNTIEKVDTTEIEKRVAGLVERLDAMPNDFAEHFDKNIDVLGMPDFRKLAMGLQAQIDEVRADITSEEAGDVDSVNGQTGAVVLDTGDIAESGNLYYTEARVSANTDVAANTSARHDALTVTDSTEIDFTLTGQDLTASLKTGSIDVLKLDSGVQTSLGLADSALQSFTETDPVFTASQAFNIDATDITNLGNLSGTNTGDQVSGDFDHGGLTGLADDDHTQYALLAGRSGGQTLIGGTGSGDDLLLQSTSNATKGLVGLGSLSTGLIYDEVNTRLGLGGAPSSFFHLAGGTGRTETLMTITGETSNATGLDINPAVRRGTNTQTTLSRYVQQIYPDVALTTVRGLNNNIQVRGTTSNGITNIDASLAGLVFVDSYGGNIGVFSAFRVIDVFNVSSGSPTVTDFRALYIPALTFATNNWGIYNEGASNNWLGSGRTKIGGSSTLAASAALEVDSTTGAVLLPRMTSTQRDALTAVNGMIIYNTTTGVIEGYEGGTWVNL